MVKKLIKVQKGHILNFLEVRKFLKPFPGGYQFCEEKFRNFVSLLGYVLLKQPHIRPFEPQNVEKRANPKIFKVRFEIILILALSGHFKISIIYT